MAISANADETILLDDIYQLFDRGVEAFKEYRLDDASDSFNRGLEELKNLKKAVTSEEVELYSSFQYHIRIVEIRRNFAQGDYQTSEKLTHDCINFLNQEEEKGFSYKRELIDLRKMLGTIYMRQGLYQDSHNQLISILEDEKKFYGEDHYLVAGSLNNIGASYYYLGKIIEAEDYFTRALNIHRLSKNRQKNYMQSLNGLASIYLDKGQPLLAQKYLEEISTNLELLNPIQRIRHYQSLNILYDDLGLYAKAVDIAKKAIKELENNYPNHPDLISINSSLGSTYFRNGQTKEALDLYTKALALYENIDQKKEASNLIVILNNIFVILENSAYSVDGDLEMKRDFLIQTLNTAAKNKLMGNLVAFYLRGYLAGVMVGLGDLDEARSLHQENVLNSKKYYGTESFPYISFSIVLNNFNLEHGLIEYEKVKESNDFLIAKFDTFENPNPMRKAELMSTLVWIYSENSIKDAVQISKGILKIYQAKLGNDHPDTIEAEATYLIASSISLFMESETPDLSINRNGFENIVRDFQVLLQKVKSSINRSIIQGQTPTKKFGLLQTISQYYLFVTSMNFDNQTILSEKLANEFLMAAQFSDLHPISNSLALAEAVSSLNMNTGDSDMRSYQSMLFEIDSLNDSLIDLAISEDTQEIIKARQGISLEIRQKLSAVRSIEKEAVNSLPDLWKQLQISEISLDSLRNRINSTQALLIYIPYLENIFACLVVTKSATYFLRFDDKEQIIELIQALRESLVLENYRVNSNFDYYAANLLFEKIIPHEILQQENIQNLLVVPTRDLYSLPFPALVNSFNNYNIQWLNNYYSVAIVPSLNGLLETSRNSKARDTFSSGPFLGIGNPIFTGSNSPQNIVIGKLLRGKIADINILNNLSNLPETENELRQISSYINNPNNRLLFGSEATENQIKSMDLMQYNIIAFATHAFTKGEITKFHQPGIALTPPRVASENDDGYLMSSEIRNLKLNADFVILSACNTASAKNATSYPLSGLANSFLFAGAKSLLVSHWPVETNSALLLTTNMFKYLNEIENNKAAALRETMNSMSSGKYGDNYTHPYYWAAFSLVESVLQ